MKIPISFLLCCCLFFYTKAQKLSNIDSLKSELATCKTDTGKCYIINKLAKAWYSKSQYDTLINTVTNGLDIAEKAGSKKYQATFYHWLSTGYQLKGNYENALVNLLKALKINEEIGNKNMAAKELNNIGSIYLENKSDPKEALSFFIKSLNLKKELKDSLGIAATDINIGNIYTDLKQYTLANTYLEEGTKFYELGGDKHGMSSAYNGLGSLYTDEKDYPRALKYRLMAEKIGTEIANLQIQAISITGIGRIYLATHNDSRAKEYYTKALELSKKIDYKFGERNALEALAKIAFNQADYKASYGYQLQLDMLKDTMFNEDSDKRMAELQVKYETAKKEKEIQQLGKEKSDKDLLLARRKNEIFYILMAVLFALFAISVFYFRYRAIQEKKIVASQLELKELKEQQQEQLLHTIVKTQEEERNKLAGDLHDGLGQILTAAKMNLSLSLQQINGEHKALKTRIDTSLEMVIDALAESKNIASDLLPLNFKERGLLNGIREICEKNNQLSDCIINFYAHDIPPQLPQIMEINVYRICQELITNCVKHARASFVNLQLFFRDGKLVMQVEDDGVGFNHHNPREGGIGLRNIKSRVQLLSGEIAIDSAPGKGCTIIIDFPLNAVKNDQSITGR